MTMENSSVFVIGLAVGALIVMIVTFIFSFYYPVQLSQGTGNDICKKIVGNDSMNMNSYSENGKLVCEIPSFDNTRAIIIKNSGEEK